jgi:phosphatidylglycerol:prolipoprotein diacylglycerol transferase
MYPILFKIGPVTIHTYGLFLAIAFLTGIGLATRQAKIEGVDPQKIFDLCFYLVLAAILGSRLLFVIINYRFYLDNPLNIFKLWKGGLVFYGGLLGAVAIGIWYIRYNQLDLWKIADILAPSIAIGQAIGRVGCFMAGCCYGRTSNLPWAVTFTDQNCLAPIGIPRHPTQLYSSGAALVIFLFLLLIYRVHSFRGQVFWSYVSLYSVGRFILEYFRADDRGLLNLLGHILSTSQVISGLTFVTGVSMLLILRKRTRISTLS